MTVSTADSLEVKYHYKFLHSFISFKHQRPITISSFVFRNLREGLGAVIYIFNRPSFPVKIPTAEPSVSITDRLWSKLDGWTEKKRGNSHLTRSWRRYTPDWLFYRDILYPAVLKLSFNTPRLTPNELRLSRTQFNWIRLVGGENYIFC